MYIRLFQFTYEADSTWCGQLPTSTPLEAADLETTLHGSRAAPDPNAKTGVEYNKPIQMLFCCTNIAVQSNCRI